MKFKHAKSIQLGQRNVLIKYCDFKMAQIKAASVEIMMLHSAIKAASLAQLWSRTANGQSGGEKFPLKTLVITMHYNAGHNSSMSS